MIYSKLSITKFLCIPITDENLTKPFLWQRLCPCPYFIWNPLFVLGPAQSSCSKNPGKNSLREFLAPHPISDHPGLLSARIPLSCFFRNPLPLMFHLSNFRFTDTPKPITQRLAFCLFITYPQLSLPLSTISPPYRESQTHHDSPE